MVAAKARRRQRNTYRQRIKQLERQLRSVLRRVNNGRIDQDPGSLCDHMRELSLEEPGVLLNRITRRLTEQKRRRAAHMARRHRNRYRGRSSVATKHFFARFSQRSLSSSQVQVGAGSANMADFVANDWRPIMEAKPTDVSKITSFLSALKPARVLTSEEGRHLVESFTETEVTAALRRCRRGKACGPDQLPNDWYRDHETLLVPFLTKVCNACLESESLPTSLQQANIFCLTKKSSPQCGLDLRPLSLLNSDYKLFTRVISVRMRKTLPTVINNHQTGFVQRRTIHDTVALLTAFQASQDSSQAPITAAAMLLDFSKAYDSLDRGYLVAVLRWLGFPSQFVDLVAKLHAGTTAAFLVNGVISQVLQVSCGIRQGCPLAPLLFIGALEPLHQTINSSTAFKGVTIPAGSRAVRLTIAGYADVTTIYTADAADRTLASAALARFSEVSGLCVNASKTIFPSASSKSGPACEQDNECAPAGQACLGHCHP